MQLYRYQNRVVLAFQWNGNKSTLTNNIQPQYIINKHNHLGVFKILPNKTLQVYTIWVNYRIAQINDYIVFDLDNGSVPSGFIVVPHDQFKRCYQKLNQNGKSKHTFVVVQRYDTITKVILKTHNIVHAYNVALHERQKHSKDNYYYDYYLVK